jgi:hypothetical protein
MPKQAKVKKPMPKPPRGQIKSEDLRAPDMTSPQLTALVRLIRKAP